MAGATARAVFSGGRYPASLLEGVMLRIRAERNITCLMVTHNMHQALELGNRTLMMDSGNIVLDITGEERKKITVDDLLEQFAVRAGKALDNDRILFSKVEGSNS